MNSHLLPLFISYRSSGEKLIKYQANSSCVIMSLILMTPLFYKALISRGETWCWSLLGLKGLTNLWALCDAKNNGVWPQASSTLANAPDASNTAAQSKWPKYAAWWSGVLPNLIKKGAVKYHCWPWIGPEWRNVSELMQHNGREKDDTKM